MPQNEEEKNPVKKEEKIPFEQIDVDNQQRQRPPLFRQSASPKPKSEFMQFTVSSIPQQQQQPRRAQRKRRHEDISPPEVNSNRQDSGSKPPKKKKRKINHPVIAKDELTNLDKFHQLIEKDGFLEAMFSSGKTLASNVKALFSNSKDLVERIRILCARAEKLHKKAEFVAACRKHILTSFLARCVIYRVLAKVGLENLFGGTMLNMDAEFRRVKEEDKPFYIPNVQEYRYGCLYFQQSDVQASISEFKKTIDKESFKKILDFKPASERSAMHLFCDGTVDKIKLFLKKASELGRKDKVSQSIKIVLTRGNDMASPEKQLKIITKLLNLDKWNKLDCHEYGMTKESLEERLRELTLKSQRKFKKSSSVPLQFQSEFFKQKKHSKIKKFSNNNWNNNNNNNNNNNDNTNNRQLPLKSELKTIPETSTISFTLG